MKIGISLPVREMRDDWLAINDFAQSADDLGLTQFVCWQPSRRTEVK